MGEIGKCSVDWITDDGDQLYSTVHRVDSPRHFRNHHVFRRLFISNFSRRRFWHQRVVVFNAFCIILFFVEEVDFIVSWGLEQMRMVRQEVLESSLKGELI